MNDASWRRLLNQIHDGLVVPVVGPQLLMVGGDGKKSLQAMVAERLLAMYEQPVPAEGLPRYRELNEAVTRLKRIEVDNQPLVRNAQDLYGDVHDAIRQLTDTANNVPAPILQLAQIADFRLFVTLTPDDLLARSLRKRCAVNEIVHSPELGTSEWRDLPTDWRDRAGEVQLLYLFGKSRSAPVFAINEEDILEYAHSMIVGGGHVPARFFGELQQQNLLMIGCNFPDWLSRLFLRITNKARLSALKSKREWLIEQVEAETSLVTFLQSYSKDTEILSDIAPLEFVAELNRRWTEQAGREQSAPAPANESPPPRAVFFVSYSRSTDLSRAEAVVQALSGLGLAEGEVWFDRQAIEPGENFRNRILDGIAGCRYFLPLVSQAAVGREEGFVFREWRAANDRRKDMNREFVYPVIVDSAYEPERYRADAARDWSDLDFGYAPEGVPDERTAAKLTKLLREARKN
jgi:hypothetical protein